MARYVTDGLIATLAAQFGVTAAQVEQFISANQANITAVYQHVGQNQGASNTEIAASLTLDQTTCDRILALLVAANRVEEF